MSTLSSCEIFDQNPLSCLFFCTDYTHNGSDRNILILLGRQHCPRHRRNARHWPSNGLCPGGGRRRHCFGAGKHRSKSLEGKETANFLLEGRLQHDHQGRDRQPHWAQGVDPCGRVVGPQGCQGDCAHAVQPRYQAQYPGDLRRNPAETPEPPVPRRGLGRSKYCDDPVDAPGPDPRAAARAEQ